MRTPKKRVQENRGADIWALGKVSINQILVTGNICLFPFCPPPPYPHFLRLGLMLLVCTPIIQHNSFYNVNIYTVITSFGCLFLMERTCSFFSIPNSKCGVSYTTQYQQVMNVVGDLLWSLLSNIMPLMYIEKCWRRLKLSVLNPSYGAKSLKTNSVFRIVGVLCILCENSVRGNSKTGLVNMYPNTFLYLLKSHDYYL